MFQNLHSYFIGFAVTSGLIWLLAPLARRLGLVDLPSERKSHKGAVPLIGGIAMFLGFLFAVLTLDMPLGGLRPLFAGAAMLVVVGLLDDFHELSTRTRFGAQIGAALLMVYWGGIALQDMGAIGPMGGMASLGVMAVPLTVFATVGVINSINMSDGMDGQAGSLVVVTVICLTVIAWHAGLDEQLQVLLVLLAVLLGFLAFNIRAFGRHRALVFMGDAGSMFLGFVMTWFVVSLSQGEGRSMAPVTALWILLVPLFDTVGSMFRRILNGRSPFSADRRHFHHALMQAGFGHRGSLLVVISVAVLAAVLGMAGLFLGLAENLLFYGFLLLFGLYFVFITRTWRVRRLLGRPMVDNLPGREAAE